MAVPIRMKRALAVILLLIASTAFAAEPDRGVELWAHPLTAVFYGIPSVIGGGFWGFAVPVGATIPLRPHWDLVVEATTAFDTVTLLNLQERRDALPLEL